MKNPISSIIERFSGVAEYPRRYEDETYPARIRSSARSLDTYWMHYRDNPIVRAAVVEAVHAAGSIPFIAEYYSEPDKAYVPFPATDRLQRLLRRPSRSVPASVFYGSRLTEFAVTGNMYLWKRRDKRTGEPLEFWGLHPNHTRPEPGKEVEIGGYRYDPTRNIGDSSIAVADAQLNTDPGGTVYRREDVIHVPTDQDPTYPLLGLSPIASALKHIDVHNAITDFTTAVLENNAVVDKALVTKQRVNDSEARRIERRWGKRRSGPKNAGGLVVIDGTEGTLQNIGMSIGARDMALTDLEKTIEALILMAMDVPPIVVGAVVGLENATYSNYMQAKLAFHEENTDPNTWRFASALEFGLEDEFPEHRDKLIRIRPDMSRVMALLEWEDKRRRLSLAEFAAGVTTQTETRAATDRPPLPNGGFLNIPLHAAQVEPENIPDVIAALTDPQAPSAPDADVAARHVIHMRAAMRKSPEDEFAFVRSYASRLGAEDAAEVARRALSHREDIPAQSLEKKARRVLAWAKSEAAQNL